MQPRAQVATLEENASLEEVVAALTAFPLGLVCILGSGDELLGVITDGDIRRAVLDKSYDATADAMMARTPVTIAGDERLSRVLEVMENPDRKVYVLPVIDKEGVLQGVIRMHDIVGS